MDDTMNDSPPAAADMAPETPGTSSNPVDMPGVVQGVPSSASSTSSRQTSPDKMTDSQLPSSSSPATPENVPIADEPPTSPPSRQSTSPRPASPEMTVSPLSASPPPETPTMAREILMDSPHDPPPPSSRQSTSSRPTSPKMTVSPLSASCPTPKTATIIPEILMNSPRDPPPPPSPRPKPLKFTNHFPERPPLLRSTKASSQTTDSLDKEDCKSLGLLTAALTETSGVAQRRGKIKLHLGPPQRDDDHVEGSSGRTRKPGPGHQAQLNLSDKGPSRSSTGSSAWNPVNSSLPQKRKLLDTLGMPSSSPPTSGLSSGLLGVNTRNRPLAKPCTCDASPSSTSNSKPMPTPPFTPGLPWPTSSQKPTDTKIPKADALHDISSKPRTNLKNARSSAAPESTETSQSEQLQPADIPNTSSWGASLPPPPPIPEAVRCYACTMNRAVQAEIEARNRWAPKIRALEYWIKGIKTYNRSIIAHIALLRQHKMDDKRSYEDLRDYQIDKAWHEFNRWHGQEARRLAAEKAREQLLELWGSGDSDSDDSSAETDTGAYGDQDAPHPSEPKRGSEEGPSGGEAHEEDRSAGSDDMEVDDLGAEENRDWDAEAEHLAIERDQAWEDERRQQRKENARLRAALEKSKADNQKLAKSVSHMKMILNRQQVMRDETVKSNPTWLKRSPEPNDLQPPKAKRTHKNIAHEDRKESVAEGKQKASSSTRAAHLANGEKEGTPKANGHETGKRENKKGIEEPLNWDPRNQCDEAAVALKEYREELARRENERCRRMLTATAAPVVPLPPGWRKLFKAAQE